MANYVKNEVEMKGIAKLPVIDGHGRFCLELIDPDTDRFARDTEIVGDDVVTFETNWTSPVDVIEELSRQYPDVPVRLTYVDEFEECYDDMIFLNGEEQKPKDTKKLVYWDGDKEFHAAYFMVPCIDGKPADVYPKLKKGVEVAGVVDKDGRVLPVRKENGGYKLPVVKKDGEPYVAYLITPVDAEDYFYGYGEVNYCKDFVGFHYVTEEGRDADTKPDKKTMTVTATRESMEIDGREVRKTTIDVPAHVYSYREKGDFRKEVMEKGHPMYNPFTKEFVSRCPQGVCLVANVSFAKAMRLLSGGDTHIDGNGIVFNKPEAFFDKMEPSCWIKRMKFRM